jgi:hypothetical protein
MIQDGGSKILMEDSEAFHVSAGMARILKREIYRGVAAKFSRRIRLAVADCSHALDVDWHQ